MKVLPTLILVITTFLVGCATAHKMNRISIGMNKKQVLSVMGRPTSTASPGGGEEFFRYNLSATSDDAYYGITDEYYVRLIDGKVESYGRMGDFDSIKNSTLDVNVNTGY